MPEKGTCLKRGHAYFRDRENRHVPFSGMSPFPFSYSGSNRAWKNLRYFGS